MTPADFDLFLADLCFRYEMPANVIKEITTEVASIVLSYSMDRDLWQQWADVAADVAPEGDYD